MPTDFTQLRSEMTRIEGEVPTTRALLETLFNAFEAAKDDPAEIQDLVTRGRAVADSLSSAVAEFTPAPA